VAAQPSLTAEQLAEALRRAPAATEDDVTVLRDGRRIDSAEAAMTWLNELAAARSNDQP
jgi:hypothetical protein